MDRVPEPELMDDPAQARAYAAADMAVPHEAFVAGFRTRFPRHQPQRVLDLGCGSGDITIRFARAYPEAQLLGIDAAPPMLDCAAAAIRDVGLEHRIRLQQGDLLAALNPQQTFDTVICNSVLHHLQRPENLWQALTRHVVPAAALWVMDLRRPPSLHAAAVLVEQYAAGDPELFRQDFYRSLCAAYTVAEVRTQLDACGLQYLTVEAIGDRHLAVFGWAPSGA